MNCTECTVQLHEYVDGELPPTVARAVEAHLAGCAHCRAELDSLRALRRATVALPKEIAPARDLWTGIASAVESVDTAATRFRRASDDASTSAVSSRSVLHWFVPLSVAAAIVFFASAIQRFGPSSSTARAWSVASIAGAPRVGAHALRGEGQFRVGQWLETDAASRARVAVGSIGEVNVEPNSRLRLVDAAATAHRLELERGTMHALIWAPPRLFFVDTPSATAVDLGCAYTLTVADNGGGELHVTTGYVALEHQGREAIIPAGAMCLTRRDVGPGTPFAEGASDALRAALQRRDFQRATDDATLHEILTQARAEDAVTLWHLLARTEDAQRAAVFDTLAQLHAPPAGVTRAGILAGDTAMRHAWAAELGLGVFATR